MARTNTAPKNRARTHEGAPARAPKDALHELERAVASCLLWEDNFYESGEAIADRIKRLAGEAPADRVADLAVRARTEMKLRHAPLWLLSSLISHGRGPSAQVYAEVIRRADEMGELIAMHWKDGKRPLPAQMKLGLAQAFGRFDEYQLGKYDRKAQVRLRDVLRLVHAKPANDEQAALWGRVISGDLATPDTWEVALSAGADKAETFTRLIREGRLGYLALIRNLRNMDEAGVDHALINDAIRARKGAGGILPFQFLAAARFAPAFEAALDEALAGQIEFMPRLPGLTVVCVDTSGSMEASVSAKSKVSRAEVAAVLGCMVNGRTRLLQFASTVEELPARPGLVGADTIRRNIGKVGHSTDIAGAVAAAERLAPDRIVIVSDMQSATSVRDRKTGCPIYAINVAPYQNMVQIDGRVVEISGFSENVLRYIMHAEGL